jgi:hypothetical protein
MERIWCHSCNCYHWIEDFADEVTLYEEDIAEALWQAGHPDAEVWQGRVGQPARSYWQQASFVIALAKRIIQAQERHEPYPWEMEDVDKKRYLLELAAKSGGIRMNVWCPFCKKMVEPKLEDKGVRNGHKVMTGECPYCDGPLCRDQKKV